MGDLRGLSSTGSKVEALRLNGCLIQWLWMCHCENVCQCSSSSRVCL